MFDTKPHEDKMNQALGHFKDELKKLRTGRAHPNMLDGVVVEVYGTKMPLNQTANISAPEPQMLLVTPFDPTNVQAISEAIGQNKSLGFNPSDDGRVVRVPVPQLTEERRQLLVKQLGEKIEECRITIRNIRHEGLKDARALKDKKELGQDDLQRVEKDLDKSVAETQAELDSISKDKEKDILTI